FFFTFSPSSQFHSFSLFFVLRSPLISLLFIPLSHSFFPLHTSPSLPPSASPSPSPSSISLFQFLLCLAISLNFPSLYPSLSLFLSTPYFSLSSSLCLSISLSLLNFSLSVSSLSCDLP